MTLVYDRRQDLPGPPYTHAFIVGVSEYQHLAENEQTARRGPPTYSLTKLPSSAISALSIFDWLKRHQDDLARPLATCRMLLSPRATERNAVDQALTEVHERPEQASRKNFVQEAERWRKEANDHPDSMTIFYFCGHGLQQGPDDAVILFDDFGDGIGGVLTNAGRVRSLYYGMAPSGDAKNIGQTQIYFLDCCRIEPREFASIEREEIPGVFQSVRKSLVDKRSAPIYYAALPGTAARALNEYSFFSRALIECLDRAGGQGRDTTIDSPEWHVNLYSLNEALTGAIDDMKKKHNVDLSNTMGGNHTNKWIVKLPNQPTVPLSLSLDEPTAVQSISVNMARWGGQIPIPSPLDPYPFSANVPMDQYRISCQFPPGAGFKPDEWAGYIRGYSAQVTLKVRV